MSRSKPMTTALLGLALLVSGIAVPAVSEEFKSIDECKPGLQVVHRDGSTGTVVDNSNGSCRVRLGNGQEQSWLFWMTRPAGASSLTADKLVPGLYPCWSGSMYLYMDLIIRNATTYQDRKGASGQYRLNPATNKISFLSGPYKGFGAMLMAGPRVGMNANHSGFYSTTCSLKR